MINQIFNVGDRVNVKNYTTKTWQTQKGLKNGVVTGADNLSVTVERDEDSGDFNFMDSLNGGRYTKYAFNIEKIN